MCGFVGDGVDVKKLDAENKEALKAFLRDRKEYLEGRIHLINQDLKKLGK